MKLSLFTLIMEEGKTFYLDFFNSYNTTSFFNSLFLKIRFLCYEVLSLKKNSV